NSRRGGAFAEAALERADNGQAVEQVMGEHLGRVAEGRQVVDPIPALDQGEIFEELASLLCSQLESELRGGGGEFLVQAIERPDVRLHRAARCLRPSRAPRRSRSP